MNAGTSLGTIAFWLLLGGLIAWEVLRPLHRRPREAQGRLIANFGLGAVNFSMVALLPLSTVGAAAIAERHGIGLLALLAFPPAAALAATILLRSLAAYALHVLAHRVPLLWRMHRVHHADTAVDLSTGFRHHPLELLFIAAAHAALAFALGLSVAGLAAYEASAVALTLWTHANARLPKRVARLLGLLLVTPELHHVHHSARRTETDSNFGEVLTIWDRLFRTFRRLERPALESMPIGLGAAYDRRAGNLLDQVALPFRSDPPAAAAARES